MIAIPKALDIYLCFIFVLAMNSGQTLSSPFLAQEQQYRFSHLNTAQGLSQNSVNAIVQDKQGFLWIGTSDGLNRFDGYDFTVFRKTFDSNDYSLGDNAIKSLYLDRQGNLWIGGFSNGIQRYDISSQRFYHFPQRVKGNVLNSNTPVSSFYQDPLGRLWASSRGNGLFRLDREQQQFIQVPFLENLENLSNSQPLQISKANALKVNHLSADGRGNLLLATRDGLYIYSPSKKSSRRVEFSHPDTNAGNANFVIVTLPVSKVEVLVGTLDGLYRLNTDTGAIKAYLPDPDNRHALTDRVVEALVRAEDGTVWVGTQNGLNIFDPATESFKHLRKVDANPQSINDNVIRSLFIDSYNNLWIGLNSYGLDRLSLNAHQFGLVYKTSATSPHCIGNDTHFNILRSRSGHLWLESYHQGIHKIDLTSGQCRWFNATANGTDKIANRISPGSLFEDSRGDIWFGTIRGPLYRIRDGDKVTAYSPSAEITGAILSGGTRDTVEDKTGNLWFALDGAGISYFNAETETFKNYRHRIDQGNNSKNNNSNNDNNSLSDNYVFALALDGNQLWIGSENGGLDRFDIPTEQFTHFKKSASKPDGLPVGIYSLLNDPQGYLWAGTLGAGLARIDKKSGKIRYFTTDEGLPNNTIYKVLQDNQSILWLATNRGITRFDPHTETSINFTAADGLQGDEFSPGGFFDKQNNRLYFASTDGFNSFNPEKIRIDNIPPQVVITEFLLFNRPASGLLQRMTDKNLSQNAYTVKLVYDQNMLSFRFAGLKFSDPLRQEYQYKLDGFDQQWLLGNSKNRISTYTNLAPGNYQFRVKASNAHGVWGPETSVNVVVTPPWYLTWWAQTAYVILAIALLLCLYFYRTRQIRARNRQLETTVKERTQALQQEKQRVEQLLQNKSKEFENISHEFRTPLAIIRGRAQQHLGQSSDPHIDNAFKTIHDVTQRLALVVDDVIEMGKVEHFQTADQLQIISVSDLLRDICHQMQAFADLKQQFFHTEIAADILQRCSARMLEKLFTNLIANAIKYTAEQGSVTVKLTPWENNHYQFSVTDTGVGIPAEQQTLIFQRFYRCPGNTAANSQGTGIGLSLVQDMVNAYGGNITLNSTPGKGSIFTVQLPRVEINAIKNETEQNPQAEYSVSHERLAVMMGDVTAQSKPVAALPHKQEHRLNNSDATHSKQAIFKRASLKQETLLIVEDNLQMRLLLEDQLAPHYQVISACDGEAGLKLALREVPDIIVSDINMPNMDGYTLVDKIKHHPATSHIPVILLTAKIDVSSRIEGFNYKADGYIAKPYEPKELFALIATQRFNREKIQTHALKLLRQGESLAQTPIDNHSRTAMERSLDYIRNHYTDREISVNGLAAAVFLSERQLSRKFQETLGISPSEFINDYRLKIARPLIIKGMQVGDVAQKVGFSSANYFSRQYKKKFGVAPRMDAKN